MSEVIVITSGKGGVGKTTTSANVGTGLAKLNKKVVLIDTDIGLRNLDVVMGLENRIVYNLVDVVEVDGGDHRLFRHVGKQCDLASLAVRQRLLAAADQHVGLNADAAQFLHRMLGGLGLEFTGGGDPLVLQALVTKTSSAAKYEFHVMGSGVIDLVLLANAAEDKYHVTAGGKLAVTIDGVVTELVLGTVTAG